MNIQRFAAECEINKGALNNINLYQYHIDSHSQAMSGLIVLCIHNKLILNPNNKTI